MGKRTIGVAVALVAAAALAGCGGSVPDVTVTFATPQPLTTPPAPQLPTAPTVPQPSGPQVTPQPLVPQPTTPTAPQLGPLTTPTSPGSPSAPFVRGPGAEIGGTTRLDYTADTFGGLPPGYPPGGIPIGSRAGACTVPQLTAVDRAELLATALRQTPGQIAPLRDDEILLADCGAQGYWAMVTWTVRRPHRGPTTYVDELRFDGGTHWTGTPSGVQPGCRMPLDAAAVWPLDVSPCGNSRRGGGVPKRDLPGTLLS